ncbi:ABC transporter substrate-binding protein [Paenibacillus guangzhouensis]|uniref:ABC transporter substrate-binding protein n=1 Tax=Paenibacillus guangzhouensis TaxID=1473112 RepID=UPI00187B5EFB|nr:extracellular solute-binding protein [Paenibacillus guangzhouensis]
MRKTYSMLLVSLLALTLLLSACSEKLALEPLDAEQNVKLKVLFWEENYFYQEYGNYFTMKYPNVEFEVISTTKVQQEMEKSYEDYQEAMYKFIEENQPDILMLQPDQYEKLASEGKLYELDTIMNQEKFDTESFLPSVMQMLKDKGGGKTYGLAATFGAQVIYYNVDLFQKHGVEVPKNQMTWDQVLQLAQRFPTSGSDKDRIYGLNLQGMGGVADLIMSLGRTENLRWVDKTGKKVQFDSESWRKAYQLATNSFKSGAIYDEKRNMPQMGDTMESYLARNPFTVGRSAMTIGGSWYMNEISRAKDQIKDFKPFQWGVVTAPINPAEPNSTNNMYLSEIMAVNAKSANTRAAWEFVKFVNGPEMARMQSRQMSGNLPTRKEFIKDKENHDLSAFYLLTPKFESYNSKEYQVPNNFYMTQNTVLEEQTKQYLDNKQSVEQAITNIQKQLQEGLDKGWQEDEAKKKKDKEKEAAKK